MLVCPSAAEDASLAKFRSILGKPSMAVEDTAASSTSSSAAAKPEPVADPRDGPVDAAGVLLTTRGASRRMEEIEATRRAVDKIDAARGSAPDGSEYLYTNGLAYEVAHLTGGPIRKGGRAKGSEHESREQAGRAKRAAPGSSVGAKALQAKIGTVEIRRGGRRSKTRVISRMFDWKTLPKAGNED